MQHSSVPSPSGPSPSSGRPISIEVAGEPVGVVVPSSEGFRFLAVKFPVFKIDGVVFDTIEAASKAAHDAADPRRHVAA